MRVLIASVAAIAVISGSAIAQPGNDKGRGNAAAERPASGGKNDSRGGGPKTESRGNGNQAERTGSPAARDRGPDRSGPQRGSNGNDNRFGTGGQDRAAQRAGGPPPGKAQSGRSSRPSDDRRNPGIDVRFVDRDGGFGVFRDYDRRAVAYRGCPPGLAKKYNGCLPPGLAAKQPVWRPSFFGYDGYGGTRFYYDDGFLIRLGSDGRISASIPLLGGALAIGNPWPDYYRPVELRPYYTDFYGLRPNGYRYANNVLYRVDPETAAITSIAALLTGDDFVIGQPAPLGYDVYNVPYRYRDRYRDGPDGYYRYSDGYVYRLDPETRLVAAAIELALD